MLRLQDSLSVYFSVARRCSVLVEMSLVVSIWHFVAFALGIDTPNQEVNLDPSSCCAETALTTAPPCDQTHSHYARSPFSRSLVKKPCFTYFGGLFCILLSRSQAVKARLKTRRLFVELDKRNGMSLNKATCLRIAVEEWSINEVKMGPSQVPQSAQCLLSTADGYLVEVVGWALAETVLCVTSLISSWVRGKRLVESSLRKCSLKNWKHLCQATERILFFSDADPQCEEKATQHWIQSSSTPAALSLPSFTFMST